MCSRTKRGVQSRLVDLCVFLYSRAMAQRRVKAQLWDIFQTKGEGLYLLMLNESSRLRLYVFLFAFLPSSFRYADQTVICSFERWLGIFACISFLPACQVPTPSFDVETPFVIPDYAPHPKRLVVPAPCSSSCHISICSCTTRLALFLLQDSVRCLVSLKPSSSFLFFSPLLHQMRRQQEIRNPLFDSIFMTTMSTDQFSISHTRFHQQCM